MAYFYSILVISSIFRLDSKSSLFGNDASLRFDHISMFSYILTPFWSSNTNTLRYLGQNLQVIQVYPLVFHQIEIINILHIW